MRKKCFFFFCRRYWYLYSFFPILFVLVSISFLTFVVFNFTNTSWTKPKEKDKRKQHKWPERPNIVVLLICKMINVWNGKWGGEKAQLCCSVDNICFGKRIGIVIIILFSKDGKSVRNCLLSSAVPNAHNTNNDNDYLLKIVLMYIEP